MTADAAPTEPSRSEIDALPGSTMIEFGTSWCGHCRAAQPSIATALRGRDAVRHIRVEDGSGRLLGRTFGVKLWPTLVFMRDGREIDRLVRPRDAQVIVEAIDRLQIDG